MDKCSECNKDFSTTAGYIKCSDCDKKLCPDCIKDNFKCKDCS